MKQEERNLISRQRIMASARHEFGERGYALGSVNAICAAGGISKGILYHYFSDKDEIYLLCVQACFDGLTARLEACQKAMAGSISQRLSQYFDARFDYFSSHPESQRLFCEAVLSPPEGLKRQIAEIRRGFDRLNMEILEALLAQGHFRQGVTRQDVVAFFCQYQDFINARYRISSPGAFDIREHERLCQNALRFLLYGVLDPEQENA